MVDLKSKGSNRHWPLIGHCSSNSRGSSQRWCQVFGCDISPSPSTLSSCSDFKFQQCNLINSDSPASIVKACHHAFGDTIHVLLKVAGIGDTYGSVDTLTEEKWDRIIITNLTAPVRLMREEVLNMKKNGGGSIVNVASKGGT